MSAPAAKTSRKGAAAALVKVAKLLCGLTLLGVLAWQAQAHDSFARLVREPKRWDFLLGAVAITAAAMLVSFQRWRLVARAAGVEMSVLEALRLGSLGFAMNFIALGSVGGDVFKAAFLAKRQPGKGPAAVASVLLDRALGLFTMLAYASVAAAAAGCLSYQSGMPEAAVGVGRGAAIGLAIGAVGVAIALLTPTRWIARVAAATELRLGASAANLLRTWLECRSRGATMAAALAMNLFGQALLILGFYCVARGLPLAVPGLLEHFVIAPLGLIAAALPISPNGLGTTEAAVELLYRALGDGATGSETVGATSGVVAGNGALVAFGHRLTLMLLGGLAGLYYFTAPAARVAMATESAE
ncbi:hypothetical protein Mal64_10540 [Pseudobythopirellula maris]|uniref:Uncharacterized protein n=1 Tax=Pseudobythopirellula maris TaxID=2527991 RepID=A0A5C5ZT30_9BACT|nr:lysylphosphatidylglycerol synthase transmembrane domain-containing protein [Pseudobythopirellula maris]TWT90659.1 hypothetical protein Mal64_10540 [Pseudobythopirellula maris]